MNLKDLQAQVRAWGDHNFGAENTPIKAANSALSVCEEAGEVAHAQRCAQQAIRGTAEEHYVAAVDAVGDTVIALASYCNRAGIDMAEAVALTWAEVSQRDWVRFPNNGRTE